MTPSRTRPSTLCCCRWPTASSLAQQDAARIAEQPLAREAQVDVDLGRDGKSSVPSRSSSRLIDAHGRLRGGSARCRAGERTVVGHGHEGLQQLGSSVGMLIRFVDQGDQQIPLIDDRGLPTLLSLHRQGARAGDLGIAAAMLSSAPGGAAVGATRCVAGVVDPAALGAFASASVFGLLLPMALLRTSASHGPRRATGPRPPGWAAVLRSVPCCFFGRPAAPHDRRARRAGAVGAAVAHHGRGGLRVDSLRGARRSACWSRWRVWGWRCCRGCAPHRPMRLRGDLLMLSAALRMAFYSVGSRPLIRRSGPLTFTAVAMAVGALCLTGIAPRRAAASRPWLPSARPSGWRIAYLGVFGGAIVFFLWAFGAGPHHARALAISVTVNPVAAGLGGCLGCWRSAAAMEPRRAGCWPC